MARVLDVHQLFFQGDSEGKFAVTMKPEEGDKMSSTLRLSGHSSDTKSEPLIMLGKPPLAGATSLSHLPVAPAARLVGAIRLR